MGSCCAPAAPAPRCISDDTLRHAARRFLPERQVLALLRCSSTLSKLAKDSRLMESWWSVAFGYPPLGLQARLHNVGWSETAADEPNKTVLCVCSLLECTEVIAEENNDACRYEALRSVTFFVQILGKSFMMMSVMVWGRYSSIFFAMSSHGLSAVETSEGAGVYDSC